MTLSDRIKTLTHIVLQNPINQRAFVKEEFSCIKALVEKPIDMILLCPNCHEQHIDRDKPDQRWKNEPHKTHKCDFCNTLWRPADVYTNGVLFIESKGNNSSEFVTPNQKSAYILNKEYSDQYRIPSIRDNYLNSNAKFIWKITQEAMCEMKKLGFAYGQEIIIYLDDRATEIHRFRIPSLENNDKLLTKSHVDNNTDFENNSYGEYKQLLNSNIEKLDKMNEVFSQSNQMNINNVIIGSLEAIRILLTKSIK